MFDFIGKLATCIVTTCLLYTATFKSLGILQQAGYENEAFLRWLKRKDNLYFNRLTVWSVLTLFTATLASVATALVGKEVSLVAFVSVCYLFAFFYCLVDKKYALKVPVKLTARLQRLSLAYLFVTATAIYLILSVLGVLEFLIDNKVYTLFSILPLALVPILTPALLVLANTLLSPFEKKNNARYLKQAKTKLQSANLLRIGVVGSYGKTSVKNILASILSQKYSVVVTPESYNTPMGIAKTVNCFGVETAEVFIAEMGARREGDIAELCEFVEPDYAIFTGVCRQHLETFQTEENLLNAKCEIVKGVKRTVVCGESLRGKIQNCATLTPDEKAKCLFVDMAKISNLRLEPTKTTFTIQLGEERLDIKTTLLGDSAVENITLAVTMAYALGLTKTEIALGLETVKPIEHRLSLIENGGVYILDDAYNCSERSAREAVAALCRFEGRKFIVTPGIVECGVLEETINAELGARLAQANLDRVLLVGQTLVQSIKDGYLKAGGNPERLTVYPCLEDATAVLSKELRVGDAVLFLNDLPDRY